MLLRAELWLESRGRSVKRDVTFQAGTEHWETHRGGSCSTFGYRERDGSSWLPSRGSNAGTPHKEPNFQVLMLRQEEEMKNMLGTCFVIA